MQWRKRRIRANEVDVIRRPNLVEDVERLVGRAEARIQACDLPTGEPSAERVHLQAAERSSAVGVSAGLRGATRDRVRKPEVDVRERRDRRDASPRLEHRKDRIEVRSFAPVVAVPRVEPAFGAIELGAVHARLADRHSFESLLVDRRQSDLPAETVKRIADQLLDDAGHIGQLAHFLIHLVGLALEEQELRDADARREPIGIDRERAFETLLALAHAPQHEQRDGVFEQIRRRARIELQRALEVRDRRDVVAGAPIQAADLHEEIGVVGLTLLHGFEFLQRARAIARAEAYHMPSAMRDCGKSGARAIARSTDALNAASRSGVPP